MSAVVPWLGVAMAAMFLGLGNVHAQDNADPGTSSGTAPPGNQYGYYYKGKFVPLTASEQLIAVSEARMTLFTPFVSARGLDRDPRSEMAPLTKRKLGIYKMPTALPRMQGSRTQATLDQFAQSLGDEVQPVFEQGMSLLIPTDELIVKFKQPTTLDGALSYFARHRDDLGISRTQAHRNQTYIVTIDNPSNGRIYQVCQALAGQEEIEFAEPNHIVVLSDLPPRISAPPKQPFTGKPVTALPDDSPVKKDEIMGPADLDLPAEPARTMSTGAVPGSKVLESPGAPGGPDEPEGGPYDLEGLDEPGAPGMLTAPEDVEGPEELGSQAGPEGAGQSTDIEGPVETGVPDAPVDTGPDDGPAGTDQSGGALELDGGAAGASITPVTWTVLVDESCEGAALPAGWTTGRWNNTFTDAFWGTTSVRSHAGNRSCYATGAGTAGVAAPGNFPNNAFSWLDTPSVDLAAYEEVYIELWFYAKYEDPGAGCSVPDLGAVGIYDAATGNTDWQSVLAICYTGDLTADGTADNGWRRALVRVLPDARQDGVNIRFVFVSDGDDTTEGLYIDQIRVVATLDVDTEPLGNDTYSARHYEMKNAGQIAGLGDDSNDMEVPEAWGLVSVSSDLVVAVIDSGVDLTQPDLNLDTGYDHDGAGDGHHRRPHGTAVAGNVGAVGDNAIGVLGTAPGVRIMPVYMGGTTAENASAIDVAVANGADILSNSWGWVGAPSGDIEDAIDDALAAGRVVLFAAGNGPDRSPWNYDVAFPGMLTGSTDIICVGASSPTDEHKAAASSDGSFAWGSSYVGDGPDVVAPSPWSYTTDIQGADGYNDGSLIDPADATSADYTPSFGGTSSATPKTAGVVALMLSANPDLTPGQVKTILRETADDIDAPGVDDKTGAGRVNAEAAVIAASAAATDNLLPLYMMPMAD